MDRRKFLRGLFGSAVALTAAPVLIEEVSRVYSFPTNIVIPQTTMLTTYLVGKDAIINSDLQQYLITYYDKKFIDNLKKNTTMEFVSRRLSLPDLDGAQHYLAPAPYDPDDIWFENDED